MTERQISTPPPDPCLPGLPLVLDPAALAELLAPVLAQLAPATWAFESCSADYVRYKPGTSCHVRLRLQAAGGPEQLAALSLYRSDRGERLAARSSVRRLEARAGRRDRDAEWRRVAAVHSIGALLQVWPVDRHVRGLARASRAGSVTRALDVPVRSVEIVRYKPGRKALLRYETASASGPLYGKVLPGIVAEEVSRRLRSLEERVAKSADPKALRIAEMYRFDRRLGMVVHSNLPGIPLRCLADGKARTEAAKAAGAALRSLHDLQAPAQPTDIPGALPEHRWRPVLGASLRYLSWIQPRAGEAARPIAREIERRLAGLAFEPRVVHGDFYSDQVLVSDGGVGLLDFDEAGLGPPALDVGNFLAHEAIRGGSANQAREAFLDGYGPDSAALSVVAAYEALALMRLAVGPFRRLEPGWPAAVEEVLRLAAAALRAAGPERHAAGATAVGPTQPRAYAMATRSGQSEICSRLAERCVGLLGRTRGAAAVERVTGTPAPEATARLVRYKPGKRFVIRYQVGPGRAVYAKGFASGRAERVADVHQRFHSVASQAWSMPEPLGHDASEDLFLQAGLDGRPVLPRLRRGDGDLAAEIGRSLRALHEAEVPGLRKHGPSDEFLAAARGTDALTVTLAGVTHDLSPLLRQLEAAIESVRWRCRPLHRDFYHDQVLALDGGVAFLDFDDAKRGEPLVDVANFTAHLELEALADPRTAAGLTRSRLAFLEGYEHGRHGSAVDQGSLAVLEAAALVRLAGIHVHRRDGPRLAAALLGRAMIRVTETRVTFQPAHATHFRVD